MTPMEGTTPGSSKENSFEKQFVEIIPDNSLRTMVDDEPDSICNLIVEAKLPARKLTWKNKGVSKIGSRESKRMVFKGTDLTEKREEILLDLSEHLKTISGDENINVLRTSGAVVVNVPAKQLIEIAMLPSVKTIRRNRKLPPPKKN